MKDWKNFLLPLILVGMALLIIGGLCLATDNVTIQRWESGDTAGFTIGLLTPSGDTIYVSIPNKPAATPEIDMRELKQELMYVP